MRLVVVGPAYPLRGGIAHHVYWLARQLEARGHELRVISYTRLYPSPFFPGTTQFDRSVAALDCGAEALLDPINPISWFRALNRIKRFRPDGIVIQWWSTFFAPSLGTLIRLCRDAGMPVLVECHNVFPHEGSPLDRLLLDYALARADAFITHSESDALQLKEVTDQAPVETAALPVIDEFLASGISDRSGTNILFFGLVRRYKGLETLLRAMPLVLKSVDCRLVIVGEFYDKVDTYRSLVAELGIGNHVRIDDRYVPNEEVPEIMSGADVLVLPYLAATQSGVARIALSNALPIIVSDSGGLSEAVEDGATGLTFPAGDNEALAERLVRYFQDGLGPEFARRLRERRFDASRIPSIIEARLKP